MTDDILIREATPDDIPEIVRQRQAMYEDMDYKNPDQLAAMTTTSAAYLATALPTGNFREWFALSGETIVGGGAVIISPWPSHPYDGQCVRATILNVYVYPQHRRRGIGRRLMQTMIEWCRKQHFVNVSLHASPDGRHLYEALGFEPTNEMRLKLK
jgi:GNAT superfamily N-acetyltransferase